MLFDENKIFDFLQWTSGNKTSESVKYEKIYMQKPVVVWIIYVRLRPKGIKILMTGKISRLGY